MAEITAGLVKELRELTGLGMMECKKALTEANGDLKKAEELLRIKSGAKASKAAGLGQRLLAFHHPKPGQFAQFLDQGGSNLSHSVRPFLSTSD